MQRWPSFILMLILLALFLASPLSGALAADNPSAQVPPAPAAGQPTASAPSPNSYFGALYLWIMGIVGIAALFGIVYGGVLYIFSGAVGSTAEARKWITNAILGLVLAGASYLILSTINPALVKKFDIQSIINNAAQKLH